MTHEEREIAWVDEVVNPHLEETGASSVAHSEVIWVKSIVGAAL